MDHMFGCRSKRIIFELILCSASVLFFQLPVLAAQSVLLAWTASVSTNVVAYAIYFGTASHKYGSPVVVGNTNSATITGLAEGTTYYFSATAFDSDGDESPFSNEAVYTVPSATATLKALPAAANEFSFNVSGISGSQYVVQSSTNLMDWISMQTNTAPFTFTNTDTAKLPECFYRTFYFGP
jgi:Fibronectin type III domain